MGGRQMSVLLAGAVADHLRSRAGEWEYPEDTVDTFKVGGPATEVTGIAVAWLPFTWALERAIELGCSLFVTHEPTFYDHFDSRHDLFQLEIPNQRRKLIEEAGMAVLRCHDLWDRDPDDGITVAWAEELGLTDLVIAGTYSRLYEISPTTARAFATEVSAATADRGQQGVRLIGDGNRIVRTVCVGTGAISPYLELVKELDPDLIVCSDDGMDYWRDGAYAVDGGPPIIVVHHGVSEEPGVARLARELARAFPQVPVHHISQTAMYEHIPAPEGDANSSKTPTSGRSGEEREGRQK